MDGRSTPLEARGASRAAGRVVEARRAAAPPTLLRRPRLRDGQSRAGFVHGIDDFIGRRAVGTDELWDALGDVLLVGVEATGSWRPNACCCEGLEFFGMLGSTWSDDEDLVVSVPFHGRVGARLSTNYGPGCGLRRWFVEASARGAAESGFRADDDAFVTSELLAGASFGFGGRRVGTLTIGGVNLFDEAYTEPFARLPAYGRSLIASLSFDF